MAPPGAQVHLVDVEGALEVVRTAAAAHPQAVLPHVAGEVGEAGGGSRGALAPEGVGVGLVLLGAVVAQDVELVQLALGGAGDEALPHAAVRGLGQGVGLGVPLVELADDGDLADAGGPHGEGVAVPAVDGGPVGTHLLPAAVPVALGQQVKVVFGDGVFGGAHEAPSLLCGRGPTEPGPPFRLLPDALQGILRLREPTIPGASHIYK